MLPTWFALAGTGLLFGLQHALEADHLVAVSTLVSQHRHPGRALLVGGLWGLGHTATLALVGFIVIAFRLQLPPTLDHWLEAGVGIMLVILGLRTLLALRRERLHCHRHDHGHGIHTHFHGHAGGPGHAHRHATRSGLGSVLVGAVHGLAGSGALVLLALGSSPSRGAALAFILLFGIGATGGMMLATVAVALPTLVLPGRFNLAGRGFRLAAGVAGIGLGVLVVSQQLMAL